ncbi:MAG: cytochrome c-type biogenesis protein [Solirubrobacterales bacterium]
MRHGAAVIALVAGLLIAPAWAGASSRASLPDIEDEVMCPICGTLLELSTSPQAERERAFIRRQIARGRSKQQIEDALVAEYGDEVLALPRGSGFDLSAYLVPVLALLLGTVALAVGVVRWRQRGERAGDDPAVAPQGDDAARLESDLARYDL